MNHTCDGDVFERAGKTWGRCLRDGSLFVVTDPGMSTCPECKRPWTGTPFEEGNNFWDPGDDEDVAMLIDLPFLDAQIAAWRAATECETPDDVREVVRAFDHVVEAAAKQREEHRAELTRLRELESAVLDVFARMDCGDSSCLFAVKKGGMRTNGGCQCLEMREGHRLYAAIVEARKHAAVAS